MNSKVLRVITQIDPMSLAQLLAGHLEEMKVVAVRHLLPIPLQAIMRRQIGPGLRSEGARPFFRFGSGHFESPSPPFRRSMSLSIDQSSGHSIELLRK